jgi:hypothetical protein
MTFMGKILVLVNLALSLGFAFWAFAIYSNRIDWTTTKSADRTGEFAKRDAELQALRAALGRGEANMEEAARNVALAEDRVPKYQAWYKEQLEKLRTGKNPVQALVVKGGKLQLDPDPGAPPPYGLPQLGPVLSASKQPVAGLASIEVLNQEYAAKHQTFVDVTHELDKVLDGERQLTEQIGNGRDKGLRAQLAVVEHAGTNAIAEQEFIRPLLYNREVEGQLLVKRGNALESRLKELAGAHVARQP